MLMAACAMSIFTFKVFAQPGSLDPDFSGDGRATAGFLTLEMAEGQSVAVQSDGKIVVAGHATRGRGVPLPYQFALARYNTNGTLDNTFGSGGKVTTIAGTYYSRVYAVAVQSDGKIVVAGASNNGANSDFAVVRYNPDGTPDNSFSSDGKITTDFFGQEDYATALAIQANGKIVVAGNSISSGTSIIALVRYNADGTSDNSFGTNGKLTTGRGGDTDASSIAIAGSGKIVVAGTVTRKIGDTDNEHYFGVFRYNSDGTLDNTFDSDGYTTTDFGTFADDYAKAVCLQPDGKIVVMGSVFLGSTPEFARYNTNGSLDNSFGSGGKVISDLSCNPSSAVLQRDGKIAICGNSSGTFVIVRYNANGTMDNSFSNDGIATADIDPQNTDIGKVLALQQDGKIVVAGYSSDLGYKSNFAVVRVNSNGTLDNSFSSDGITTTTFEGSAAIDDAHALLIQPDGKILIAGNSGPGSNKDFALLRLNTGGTLDNTFSSDAKVTTEGRSNEDNAWAMCLQQNGKILVTGSIGVTGYKDIALLRYNSDGTPDNSFGTGGMITTKVGSKDDVGTAVAVQPDGKIVVAGYSHNGANNDIALVRYNTDGTLDNFFSLDGKVTKNIANSSDVAYALAIQTDGKILVAGQTATSANYDFCLLRFNANGDPDNTFSSDGVVVTNFGSNDYGRSIAIQADGKILVAGNSYNGTDYDFSVARYRKEDGSLDVTFSGDGKLVTTFDGTSNDYGQSVVLQSDGKIVMGGYSYKSSESKYNFALLRLSTNGAPDNSFGYNGMVITDFAGFDDHGTALAIQQDGKIVLAGSSSNDFAVARYISGSAATGQSGTLEAEQAVLSGAVISSNQPGFTGTGFGDYVNASGDFIEWTVNATNAGVFSLRFRYANGGTNNRPLQLKINGTVINGSLAFPPTGSWSAWSLSPVNASLISGANKIRLTTTGSNGPNIDHLAFSTANPVQALQRLAPEKNQGPDLPGMLKAYVAPNPITGGNAKLILSGTKGTQIDMQLVDMFGRILKTFTFIPTANRYSFPVDNLPAGSYIINLKEGRVNSNTKMIVER